MSASNTTQYREWYGHQVHITGRDGDTYFALCGKNLPGGGKSALVDRPADWGLCQRCLRIEAKKEGS